MKRSHGVLLLALSLCLLSLTPLEAQGGDHARLSAKIRDAVREADLGDAVGISVVDIGSGREIFSDHESVSLNPASNMKLVTAAAALRFLGSDFQMQTGLYGRVEDDAISDLVLRGYGDPDLSIEDLAALARDLVDRGVRRVARIHVDGSYFDDRILPPAFEQQPHEAAAFRAAVAAVSVDRSSYVLRVLPGAEPGETARVRLMGEGYFDVDMGTTTSEGGPTNVIASQRAVDDGSRMRLVLRGTIAAGVLGVSYRRRVENPLFHAGHVLRDLLGEVGIRGRRAVLVGDYPEGLPLLASVRSPSLAQLLHRVGKHSDNYVAEMLLKVMGAERSRPGTSAEGVAALRAMLERAGVDPDEVAIVNGSGLFDGNRIAARHLTTLLRHVYRDSSLRPEYLAQLAIGGVDGTLHRRMRDLPAPRVVRAKTGTLAGVISLSGYVLGDTPDEAVAFSFLANGVNGKHAEARRLADTIATEIARALHGD